MIIVIDIGNSTVVLSGIEGDTVVFSGEVETNRRWDEVDYAYRLRPIVSGVTCRGVIISSVVPPITEAVRIAARTLLGVEPMVVDGQTETGLVVTLPEKEKIGRDRLVDAAWAASHYPLPAVTADLGTATTLNVILPGGVFAGGIICAGIQTCLNALSQRTAQLPQLSVQRPEHLVGRNTQECMMSGAVRGTAAMVEGLVSEIETELGQPVTLLLTGGGGKYVKEYLHHPHVFDPDLTRKGLAYLYRRNHPNRDEA